MVRTYMHGTRVLVYYVDGERRSSLPEPVRGQLLQCMATTVLYTPQAWRSSWHRRAAGAASPASMKEHLKGVELHRAVQRHGLSAVLHYFIFPFMLHHTRLAPTRGETHVSRDTGDARAEPEDLQGHVAGQDQGGTCGLLPASATCQADLPTKTGTYK